jgi:TetR/AcrR family transcriptional repressor of mexJK operon
VPGQRRDRRDRQHQDGQRRAARQFVLLLATEGRVRTLHGTQPLPEAEYTGIAAETADLILRAHRRA